MLNIALLIQLGLLFAVLLLLVLILAWVVTKRRSRSKEPSKEVQAMISDAKFEDFERPSSVVAEQIEEVVKGKLAGYPDLADTVLDFGTMPDGSIDIWVNKRQYDDVKDIPDERIRKAIQEAVEQFNVK
ncbi:MAG: hypothetical protein JXB30_07920 [Anaerolineae bacterium]|nr:hypothetical protein [Anaerolineae bacterium]